MSFIFCKKKTDFPLPLTGHDCHVNSALRTGPHWISHQMYLICNGSNSLSQKVGQKAMALRCISQTISAWLRFFEISLQNTGWPCRFFFYWTHDWHSVRFASGKVWLQITRQLRKWIFTVSHSERSATAGHGFPQVPKHWSQLHCDLCIISNSHLAVAKRGSTPEPSVLPLVCDSCFNSQLSASSLVMAGCWSLAGFPYQLFQWIMRV